MEESTANRNREIGSCFERDFERQARLNGLFVRKNELTARHTYNQRAILTKSELDFTLIRPSDGRVAWVDTKAFDRDRVPKSKFNDRQVERALRYNELKVPSGFVVLFIPTREIVFYTGRQIAGAPPRTSFLSGHGVSLGKLEDFAVGLIFDNFKGGPGPLP